MEGRQPLAVLTTADRGHILDAIVEKGGLPSVAGRHGTAL
jgi:hypothetical protein